MKRAIPVIIIVLTALIAGGVFWKQRAREAAKPAEEAPAEESRVSHDDEGRVVIKVDDEAQGTMGLLVEKPSIAQLSPEVKGYGRVLDPAPLAALVMELAVAQASATASSNEYARLTLLSGQGNASERARQTAEVAAKHDEYALQSARDRLVLTWGRAVAERKDLPAFVQALTEQSAALVRIDLPAGETLSTPPSGARIFNLSGKSAAAELLGPAVTVDPLLLGRGFLLLVQPNELRLLPGEAVTGFLRLAGDPLAGVLIQADSVVRTEGSGWVFVLNSGGDSFTRIGISLDHPLETGWLVTKGITTNEYVVVTGAQTLLSEELKPAAKPE